jgi:hypothetical protein
MRNIRIGNVLFIAALLLNVPVGWSQDEDQSDRKDAKPKVKASDKDKASDFTKGDPAKDGDVWNLGPTGARGFVPRGLTRQILVKEVVEGSPADGKLLKNDVILGVISPTAGQDAGNGMFTAVAHRQLSAAIEEAEKKENGGVLVLNVWRPEAVLVPPPNAGNQEKDAPKEGLSAGEHGSKTPLTGNVMPVTIQLEVMGAYSPTAPWDCEKTAAIIDKTAQAILKNGLIRREKNAKGDDRENFGSIDRNLDALGILATGEKKYIPVLQEYVRRVAKDAEGKDILKTGENTWHGSYRNLLMCEYYLATGDEEVLPGITAQSVCMAKGVSGVGTWSHGTADVSLNGMYGPPGAYGAMNQASMVCSLSLVLAQKCGIKDPFVDEAVRRALDFVRYYVDKGCIPYGDHPPAFHHDNNGRMSIAAVLFDLAGQKEEAEHFTRMTLASYNVREAGHTGHFFSWQWGALGAARGGPEAAQSFTRNTRYFTEIERRFDGSAVYQPQLRRDHHKYGGWSTAGSRLMQYCLPRKALYITGKGGTCVTPVSGNELKEVEAAATFDPGVLSTKELLDALGSWSVLVRTKAARELGNREEDVVKDLMAMLDSSSRYARYGACTGLKYAGRQSEDAVKKLMDRVENDKDMTLRYFAIGALKRPVRSTPNNLGNVVMKATPSILKLAANPDMKQDKTNKIGREIGSLLFYAGKQGDTSGFFPNGEGVEALDRSLLIPALKKLLLNPNGGTRSEASRVLFHLNPEDIEELWAEIYYMAAEPAPSGVMFALQSRSNALRFISEHRFEEGIQVALSNLRRGWGAFGRINSSVEALSRYGSAVKPHLPKIEEWKNYKGNPKPWEMVMENIDKTYELKSIKPYLEKAKAESGESHRGTQGKPLKVYIMAGQSNMQGQSKARTLAGIGLDPELKPLYDRLVDNEGNPRVHENVYIAAFSQTGAWGAPVVDQEKHGQLSIGYGSATTETNKLGPELAFGATLYEELKEPILIIKTAWGGKDLEHNFRPPSAGPHKDDTAGHYYRLMMKHVNTVLADPGKYCPAYDPKQGCEIAGFVWFQGFNDVIKMRPRYDWYTELLGTFIRDVRNDLNAPGMPFVIGVIGMPSTKMKNMISFRNAQAAVADLPEFKGNVIALNTADFWDARITDLERRQGAIDRPGRNDKENKYKDIRDKVAPLKAELESLKGRSKTVRMKRDDLNKQIKDIIFTEDEQNYMKLNKSNAQFHYLGSAKIYSRIGEAFAKAMVSMMDKQGKNELQHLFILSGQSNMSHIDVNTSFLPVVEAAFGKENVIVVKDSKVGQPIRRWYKEWKPAGGEKQANNGDLYDRLMAKVNTAIAGQTIASVTFVWMQGERDATESHGEVYAESLKGLVKQLSDDLKRNDVHVVIGRINDFGMSNRGKPHWTMVREVQVQVAKDLPRADWVDTDDLNGPKNGIHATKDGFKTLGERFAEKAIALIKVD